jgi:hypothetical protein
VKRDSYKKDKKKGIARNKVTDSFLGEETKNSNLIGDAFRKAISIPIFIDLSTLF